MKLAERSGWIAPSATMAMDTAAKEMVRRGIDVISFGVGEPDFDTPENVKQAAVKAIEAGRTKYTPAGGIHELKVAIQQKLARDNGLEYGLDQIVVTVGAKHALYNLAQVLLDPGDEVIVPAPYWVSYVEQVRVTGAVPVVVQTRGENGFRLTAEEFRRAITPRTKALILNSPSNPTGAVYRREHLEALAEVAVEHGIAVISDEIYEPFIYGGAQHVSIASLGPEIKALTLVVNGVSKSHAMTGWRIGFIAGDSRVIKAVTSLQSHSVSNPTSIAQYAAIEALTGPQEPVQRMVAEFARRREYLVQRLRALPGVECDMPEGAFYVFPKISAVFGKSLGGRKVTDSASLCQLLLEEGHVSVVPGSAFGAEGYMRLSYATSMENLEKGMDRIERVWNALA
ncbi:MAG: pyridoxal phosphate-dependent aminotransferase [Clostridia bacterium]|nr:aspartate aminotransferase [Bacillota bacterium]MBO2521642.1 aspartate aminotransferase [Bacillota bacterium]